MEDVQKGSQSYIIERLREEMLGEGNHCEGDAARMMTLEWVPTKIRDRRPKTQGRSAEPWRLDEEDYQGTFERVEGIRSRRRRSEGSRNG